MKKILIGICGIGNGHINRQSCVIKELQKHDVLIAVATTKEKTSILKERFPNLKIFTINIPWISCTEGGIDYFDVLKNYKCNHIDQYQSFLNFCIKVEDFFNGKPDIVISDYEPNVAQYSYASGVNLICMEQQSKFLYIDDINITGNSIKEEKYRLNYFFPKFNKRIISSFFPINIKEENVYVTTPIISKITKSKASKGKIIVYFSPYSKSKNYIKLLNIIKKLSKYNFYIYCKNITTYKKYFNFNNLHFCEFSDLFREDLSKSIALFTTGGHQLISEAISIDVPIFVFPLNTYEQKYNALMVEKYKIGVNADIITDDLVENFLNCRSMYVDNIIKFKDKYYLNDWKKEIEFLINNE